MLVFIHQVLRKECDVGEYVEFLRDGSVISELLLRSCSTPLGKKKRPLPPDPTPQDRAEKIANDMFEFGISVENLFEPDDLLKAKNIPKVCNVLTNFTPVTKMVISFTTCDDPSDHEIGMANMSIIL